MFSKVIGYLRILYVFVGLTTMSDMALLDPITKVIIKWFLSN